MMSGTRKQKAAQLPGDIRRLAESLPENKRAELIAALKKIFSELNPAVGNSAAASRSTTQCFARYQEFSSSL